MVKVGDRIRMTDKCQYLVAPYGYKVGDIGVIASDESMGLLVVKMDNPKNGYIYLWCYDYELEHAEKTPPQKITQNGYEYSLVGPVKPEWLVDGAWVVRKDNGETHQIKKVFDDCFSATSQLSRVSGLTLKRIIKDYRPLTPEDYKWGDWAMYGGKRVFVVCPEHHLNHAMVSGEGFPNGLKYVPLCWLTPTF